MNQTISNQKSIMLSLKNTPRRHNQFTCVLYMECSPGGHARTCPDMPGHAYTQRGQTVQTLKNNSKCVVIMNQQVCPGRRQVSHTPYSDMQYILVIEKYVHAFLFYAGHLPERNSSCLQKVWAGCFSILTPLHDILTGKKVVTLTLLTVV